MLTERRGFNDHRRFVLYPQVTPDSGLVSIIWSLARAATSSIAIMPLPQRCEPLLLGMSVDVRSNHKGNNIEERHPGLFGKKLLRKGKCDGGGDPADPHHGPETSTDGGAYLMPGTGASDEGHAS